MPSDAASMYPFRTKCNDRVLRGASSNCVKRSKSTAPARPFFKIKTLHNNGKKGRPKVYVFLHLYGET